jgi:hypothetical protein
VEADMTEAERDRLLFRQLDRIEDTQGELAKNQGSMAKSIVLIEEKLTHRSDDPTVKGWIHKALARAQKKHDEDCSSGEKKKPKISPNLLLAAKLTGAALAGFALSILGS